MDKQKLTSVKDQIPLPIDKGFIQR